MGVGLAKRLAVMPAQWKAMRKIPGLTPKTWQ